MARLTNVERGIRAAHFLTLVADGIPAPKAQELSKLPAAQALRIVTETDFLDVVEAIRAGAGPVTVTLADMEAEAA